MSKVAILVLADTETHGDLGGVTNALMAAKEFKEGGDQIQLIFDGAGTQWPGVLSDPNHRGHGLFEQVHEVITGACGSCTKAFGAEEGLQHAHIKPWTNTTGTQHPGPAIQRPPSHHVLGLCRDPGPRDAWCVGRTRCAGLVVGGALKTLCRWRWRVASSVAAEDASGSAGRTESTSAECADRRS